MIGRLRWPGAAVGLLLATSCSTALAQSPADIWQPVVWNLQACVRSNMPLARAAGVHTTGDAVSFFRRRCEKSLQEDIEKANAGAVAVAPGRLRKAVEDQWLKLRAGGTSSYRETSLIFH